ncbi:MAG TPA: Rrf2 family transcriptional regulator [Cyclobacteriaceae bacterium]|nr:Rrf2 family transcriptional regulator [Cyclobacteriaceae bacterium]
MFSKACEYGIKATVHIATQSLHGNRVGLRDIANKIDSPEAFTAKILQLLVKAKIIDSAKGPSGGFAVNKDRVKETTLSEIVSAIDGDTIYKGCGLGLPECSAKRPCPVHYKFKVIRDDLKRMLESVTVYELSMNLKDGLTYLKR